MPQDVDSLLRQGVQKKREGDFLGAQRLYLEAISQDPFNVMGYYSLAKTCYLAGDRSCSVINYLRSLHLSLYNQWQTSIKNRRAAMPAELDPEFEAFLRRQHDAAVFLPFQQNMTTHLGHALIDLDKAVFAQAHEALFQETASDNTLAFMRRHVDQYRSSLSGAMVQLDDALESDTYSRVALFFAVKVLSWADMGSRRDVRSIYPDTMPVPNPFLRN